MSFTCVSNQSRGKWPVSTQTKSFYIYTYFIRRYPLILRTLHSALFEPGFENIILQVFCVQFCTNYYFRIKIPQTMSFNVGLLSIGFSVRCGLGGGVTCFFPKSKYFFFASRRDKFCSGIKCFQSIFFCPCQRQKCFSIKFADRVYF